MELYWILRLPHLHDFLTTLSSIFSVTSLIGILPFLLAKLPDPKGYGDLDARLWRPYKNLCFWFAAAAFISYSACVMVPTRSDLAIMMGWDAVRSESVQEVIEILKDKIK